MKIELSFQEKPRNASKEEAIRIVEKSGARIEDGRVIVPFREFTPDAKRLLEHCRKWKGFALSIDGTEYDPLEIAVVVRCSFPRQCGGICHSDLRSRGQDYKTALSELKLLDKYAKYFSMDSKLTPALKNWVEVVDDSTLVPKKTQLRDAIIRASTIPLLVCDRCTREIISESIDRLPDKITFGVKPGQVKAERLPMSEAEREAERWFNLGYERDQQKDYAGAIEAYDQALALNPNEIGSIFNRGCALLALKRYEEAEASFARVSVLLPDDAFMFKFWALSLQGLGRGEKAAELMARAEQLQPGIRDIPFP